LTSDDETLEEELIEKEKVTVHIQDKEDESKSLSYFQKNSFHVKKKTGSNDAKSNDREEYLKKKETSGSFNASTLVGNARPKNLFGSNSSS